MQQITDTLKIPPKKQMAGKTTIKNISRLAFQIWKTFSGILIYGTGSNHKSWCEDICGSQI